MIESENKTEDCTFNISLEEVEELALYEFDSAEDLWNYMKDRMVTTS